MYRQWDQDLPSPTWSIDEAGRAQIASVGPKLYWLPLELFTSIMDYLDFYDILRLCEDPEFPIERLQRRHLVDKNNDSILFHIIGKGWQFYPETKRIISVLGDWDVPNSEGKGRPLFATLADYDDDGLCEILVQSGARLDISEKTKASRTLLAEYVEALPDSIIDQVYKLYRGRIDPANTPLEPLHLAVLTESYEMVDLLLRHGANPNSAVGVLGTSLHLTKDSEIIKKLLEHGADINYTDCLIYTPLYYGIITQDKQRVAVLIQGGADVNRRYDYRMTSLGLAVTLGSLENVKALLDANCDVEGLDEGVPPLHQAAIHGRDEILPLLINKGANIAAQHFGDSVLHSANQPLTASKLISYGADINAHDRNGKTPLMRAIDLGQIPLVEVYLMAGADFCPLYLREKNFLLMLVQRGHYALFRLLMDRCDLRLAMKDGDNLLAEAIFYRHEGMANLLLGAFTHLIREDGRDGQVILSLAAEFASLPLFQKIIDSRGKMEAADSVFFNTLCDSLTYARLDILKVQMNALVRPVMLGEHVDGLLFAVTAGTFEAWDKILDARKMQPTKWMSDPELWVEPTHENIGTNCSMLKILIDNGADIFGAEWDGMRLLHIAVWRDDEQLMRTLLTAGADPVIPDNDGNSPSDWANQMSHDKMGKLLGENMKAKIEVIKARLEKLDEIISREAGSETRQSDQEIEAIPYCS